MRRPRLAARRQGLGDGGLSSWTGGKGRADNGPVSVSRRARQGIETPSAPLTAERTLSAQGGVDELLQSYNYLQIGDEWSRPSSSRITLISYVGMCCAGTLGR